MPQPRIEGPAPAATGIGTPQRILVKEVNWLGDAVMSLPALRAIRRTWPNAHLAVLVKRELAGFFDGAHWIDEVIAYTIADGMRGLADTARIILRIRRARFDLAVLFPNNFSSALWVALAAVPARAGYVRDRRGPLLTHKVFPPQEGTGAHQSQYWLAMIRSTLGIDDDARESALDVHEPHRERMRQWLGARRLRPGSPIIALAPCAAFGPAKEWPGYSAVIDRLGERGAECVLVGAPGERAKCEEVARAGSPAIVAAGETGIGELIALLSICDGFVGNDSGCAHAAAALGIPTVAIFGSTDPGRTAPIGSKAAVIYRAIECSPCLARTCRFGHYDCLRSIGPEEVVDALARLGALDSLAHSVELA
jgi:lipopolysaccharide heptosyltransferase II